MKLIDTPNTIEQIGTISDAASFKMKSSRKAFQILSDLYSDKPLAIVRELGCNAADAMVASGKTGQPFHIHIPNTLEPWITIQDFGTGISHQNIYDIYSTYFESTKTNTNSQIGCLGLGSKSPFCYTDNFSVTSIHDGVKRIYNAYFAQDGNPTIALMSQENTSESNGIAIQIPVKEKDFVDFHKAIMKAFRFFDVKPTISGGVINWQNETPMFSGDDWMFYDSNNNYECFAIMGGVTYPIDNYKVDSNKYGMLIRKGIVLKFQMGELDFAPSREHLSYDDNTIKNLNAKLEKVLTEMKEKAKEQILSKPSIYEAINALNQYNERFSYHGSSYDLKDVIYNGHDITDPWKLVKGHLKTSIVSFNRPSYRKMVNTNNTLSFEKKYKWFYDDGVKNPQARIKLMVRTIDNQCASLFTQEQMNDLVAIGFANDLFTPVSTLPSPTAKKKISNGTLVKKAKQDITCYTFGRSYKTSWEQVTLEPTHTLPKYYIVKGKTWDLNVQLNNIHLIQSKDRLKSVCDSFGISISDVVMANEREAKKLKARGVQEFVEWFDKANDFSWIDNDEMNILNSYNTHRVEDIMKQQEFKDLASDNAIKVMVEKINTLKVKYKKIINMLSSFINRVEKSYTMEDKALDFLLRQTLNEYNANDRTMFLLLAKKTEK